jgi:hypothetical protein
MTRLGHLRSPVGDGPRRGQCLRDRIPRGHRRPSRPGIRSSTLRHRGCNRFESPICSPSAINSPIACRVSSSNGMGRPSVSRGGDIPVSLVGSHHPRRSGRWRRVGSPATPASANGSRSVVVRRVGCVAVSVVRHCDSISGPSPGRRGCHGGMSFRRPLCRGRQRLDCARRLPGSPWSVIASGAQ